MSEKKFKVGEAVVLVDSGFRISGYRIRGGRPTESPTRVTKVGRKWAEVDLKSHDGSRFSATSGWKDSGRDPPTCRIVRPEDWEAEKEETAARDKLRALGIMVDNRQATKNLTNKAVWEALRGLVEQS